MSTVEDFLQFFDGFAPLVLRGITLGGDHEFTEVVMNVHKAIVFFCRAYQPLEGETYSQALERNIEYLLDYGRFIEDHHLPDQLLKFNLHLATCRLKEQCLYRGHSGSENELFIERTILAIKYHIRGKVN